MYPVRGLHYYGPTALAVTLWTQAGSIPGNQARAGSVVPEPLQNPNKSWSCELVAIVVAGINRGAGITDAQGECSEHTR